MSELKLVLGGPGCGKTTRLLSIVEQELANGVSPDAIAFVAFTKNAADEARMRAAKRFNLNAEKDLPWFRTIHSLAYKQLGMARDEVMDKADWKEVGELLGVRIGGGSFADRENTGWFYGGERLGDQMLRIVDYAATTGITLEEAYQLLDEPIDWHRLKQFEATLAMYKSNMAKLDFTDMLTTYAREGDPCAVTVAVVDEAQDLTKVQWAVVRRAFSGAARIYVGGDDDQAIYNWAGADVEHFLSLSANPEVLALSHRLPPNVWAMGQEIAGRIARRYQKVFGPSDKKGVVEHHMIPEGVDLSHGSWLLLARNQYMLTRLERLCRDQGVYYSMRHGDAVNQDEISAMRLHERLRSGKQPDLSAKEVRALFKVAGRPIPTMKELQRYTVAELDYDARPIWHESLLGIDPRRRDYYIALLRRGERLTEKPRIRIETIHGVKGAEADNVLLMTDLSARTAKGFETNPDAEHRVFYVGVTRAKEALHIVAPQSDRSYPV